MSLKIHQLGADHSGQVTANGSLDGQPFALLARGAKWVMTLAGSEIGARDLSDAKSAREARDSIWAILARHRERQKLAFLA